MADQPEDWLDASTAFTNVWVDYFDPFPVKIGRRNNNRLCGLFTCLTMRAVHIKIRPKLETDSFSQCKYAIYCAKSQTEHIYQQQRDTICWSWKRVCRVRCSIKQKTDRRKLNEWGIRWKFNPPAVPHFGGVRERLVRSFTKAVFRQRPVAEDVLSTTMCFVEQKLNNRWLQSVQTLMTRKHWLLITSCLATRTFAYPI